MEQSNTYYSDGRKAYHLLAGVLYMLLVPVAVWSAEPREAAFEELLEMDLGQLMNIHISLASRIDEKQFSSPAAVYVITQEDIRRSGYRRLPEILRMVPGLHVAKLDANKWAVSSRNSQTRYSSTMLVMIDGRHVYTPFYAGVYWESQDTFIEDIERIEVVRGPGGSLWGANAVDGIINIITRSARQTQGTRAYGLVGTGEMQYEAGARYGDTTDGGVSYRVFAKGYQTDSGEYLDASTSTNNGLAPVGADANDDGEAQQLGVRADWIAGKNSFMVQGNVNSSDFNEDRIVSGARSPNTIMTDAYNMVMNWHRSLTRGDSLNIITFYDHVSRDDAILQNDETTFDIDMQYTLQRGDHGIAWGLGYRYYDNRARITNPAGCAPASPCFGVDPSDKSLTTLSAFIQDRIRLSDRLALIIGSKFEDNDYTGFEYQPTLRTLWVPDDSTTYWAAITRAVRDPDRVNTEGILDFSGSTIAIGNPDQEAFINYTYEMGYRKRVMDTWILDGTVFYSDYRNTIQGTSASGTDDVYGFEGYIKYQFDRSWRMEAGYTYHEGDTALAAGGEQPLARLPKHTLTLRSYFDLRRDMQVDALVYYVDESKSGVSGIDIPAYTRVDVRFGWQPTRQLDVSLLLSNLLDEVHAEELDATKINTGVQRGAMLKLTYTQ